MGSVLVSFNLVLDADGGAQLVEYFFELWRRWLRQKRFAFGRGI